MADVNTATRKRKLSSQESVIEITDDDESLEISSLSADVEIVEPDGKIVHLDATASQSSDSNLEFGLLNSQTSVLSTDLEIIETDAKIAQLDTVHSQTSGYNTEFGLSNSQSSVDVIIDEEPASDVKQKLLELGGEIRRLRAENEELKSKACRCQRSRGTEEEVVLSITFSNYDNFWLYKDALIKLFKLSPELCLVIEESNLLINVIKDNGINSDEWVVIDEDAVEVLPKMPPGSSPKKKKKKLKPDMPEEDDLFTLDTTPSLSTKCSTLRYESRFAVLGNSNEENEKVKRNEPKSVNASACFNCNESHNLRDCPKPKNFGKINAARQKFKSQQFKSVRYHLEDDQRFAHLQPGKLSDKLQKALGLRHNQLPPHIYRMRQLGYPPGWLHEIQAGEQSNLMLFNFEGKSEFKSRKQAEDLELEKIIDYPGFNVPAEKSFKDEHRLYGCPPYSKEASKESMLTFIQGMKKKAEDNLETCDMDIDNPPSDREVELVKPSITSELQDLRCSSPTLRELESKKRALLAELTQDTSNSNPPGLVETNENADESVGEAFRTIDMTGTVDETLNETAERQEVNGDNECNTSSPTVTLVKTSSFGTPILKSSSPYCRLPNPNNFSQNVSEVINFENLPNATGKYEQMIGVLEKVRRTLKGFNDQKS